jgi:4-hydroxy-tetrahydrodipicolinate reductase
MRILVLGRGKTGSLVASVAAERGHSVRVLDEAQNHNAMALTPPLLVGFEVVIDFTTPEAAVQNMRACLATGAKMVVGTTGWYSHLDDMCALVQRRSAALLYGTNFSLGVQILFRLAETLREEARGYEISIEETHHVTKIDAPSGTALSLQDILKSVNPETEVEIVSHRVEDVHGEHVITARSADDVLTVKHESHSRRPFAEGAVRAAEWVQSRTGCFDFHDVFPQIYA